MYAFNYVDEKELGMRFCVITHVPHIQKNNLFYGYAPYIREMNIWLKYCNKTIIVAPLIHENISHIHEPYKHESLDFKRVEEFNITSFKQFINTLIIFPKLLYTVFFAMKQSDHIHLRCPGNMGLVGSIVQIFFPEKKKTAKYAGNWDPKAKQPLSYKLQRWILSNTLLTKNMQVLVYGDWENQTKNIKPFFTATYLEKDKLEVAIRNISDSIKMIYVGTLSPGKRPLYAIQLVQELCKQNIAVTLDFYGEGIERLKLEKHIKTNHLESIINLKGNQSKDELKKAYQEAHFMVLPSQSEGWPKAVAEAMFWGCLPISTPVSCVPYMVDFGNRGVLLEMDVQNDGKKLLNIIESKNEYQNKVQEAIHWSRKYTIDYFESEIKMLLVDE